MSSFFDDDQVPLAILRKRAYNLRWATLPSDVIPLTAADPDFPTAPEIREALIEYIRDGVFSYVPPEGLPEFREACAKFVSEKKIACAPGQILAVDSAASGMFTIARFALKPGEEALIFDPVDFLFKESVEAAGGSVKRISFDPKTRTFDLDQVRSLLTPRTKMIGICNPHNPLGRVLTEQELRSLGELAIEHDLWILNDEIWSDIVYPPHEHCSIASLSPEISRRTLSVYGFSKSFALAGLRVGFIVSPNPSAHQALVEVSKVKTTAAGVSSLSQIAASVAYEKCGYWLEGFLRHLERLRDQGVKRLNRIPGVSCPTPEGTYVLFPKMDSKMESEKIADYLLKEFRIAVVPGSPQWFGPGAQGHLRICFATSQAIFEEGISRIEAGLQKLTCDQ